MMRRTGLKKRIEQKLNTASGVMTLLVVGIITAALAAGTAVFVRIYHSSLTRNVMISGEQTTEQISDIVENYMAEIYNSMEGIKEAFSLEEKEKDELLNHLVSLRPDAVAVTEYDIETGELIDAWVGEEKLKPEIYTNLSYDSELIPEGQGIYSISEPHVESIFQDSYPWVVSITGVMETGGERRAVVLDTKFSQIASYIDNIGIGQHGYCFIMDREGNIIYHPQQQLIFAGLKDEDTEILKSMPDGSFEEAGIIYSISSKAGSDWRIVAVSFVDETITDNLLSCVFLLLVLILIVITATLISSIVLTRHITKPIGNLMNAMGEFEKNAEGFTYTPVKGSYEINSLSDSFGHMVVRIQELMAKVKKEETTLRKTELRALQAQINPHFLYNTLDSIAWMCEDGRNKEAVDMVNALARLFRISISKGHELIPIEKEVEHAKSYLKIQNFRYKNQFGYSFNVEEQCLKYYCNKITLQPIIENAIYHGINRMIDEGEITIDIYSEGDEVVFSVTDNGVGMSPEECRSILEKDIPGRTGGIGIKNVNDRVKIYFGEKYGITIESEQDKGTKVTIRMPKLKEENIEK